MLFSDLVTVENENNFGRTRIETFLAVTVATCADVVYQMPNSF